MLIDNNTHMIIYDSLSSDEKELLKTSCIKYIRNEAQMSIIDEMCSCSFANPLGCRLFAENTEITDTLFYLMDYFSGKSIEIGEIQEQIIHAIYNDITFNREQFDIERLYGSFIEYLKVYFKPILDDDLMSTLINAYERQDTLDVLNRNYEIRRLTIDDIVNRIPFILTSKLRMFFVKLRTLNIIDFAHYLIKCDKFTDHIAPDTYEKIIFDIVHADFDSVPETYFEM